MITRAFAGQPAHITFAKDFREFLHGDLVPGTTVTIYYDAERLAQVSSQAGSSVASPIACFVKFHDEGNIQTYQLWSETGELLTKSGDEPGGGTMLISKIEVPSDAEELVLWFSGTDGSGTALYDSDFGKNYAFPFLERSIQIVQGEVAADASGTFSRFSVTLFTAPEVTEVALDYRVTNHGTVAQETTRVPLMQMGSTPEDWKIWSTNAISVPFAAAISYSATYTRDGRSYFDDNNHRGYLALQPPDDRASGEQ